MQEAKKRLVEFNHAIKYLLDSDPTLTTTEVSGFLSDVYQEMHEDETNERATEFRDSCEQVLRGMQHEIFAKNIIDSLTPEFTANGEVSIEDDLRGVDIFVTYKGVRFPVDIKASTFHVREKRKNSLNPKHIIWSGIHARDVGDRFRLTTQEIAQAKGYMRTALREAYVEYMVRAQIMGRAVVERPQAASALKVQHSVRPPSKPETRPVQQEVVDSKEVATILARYFAPIRELSRANKEAQRNTLAQVLYQRIYPTFSEYLDTLEAESSPIEIREKLCRMCIKETFASN